MGLVCRPSAARGDAGTPVDVMDADRWPAGTAHRVLWIHARRDAASSPRASGSPMVTIAVSVVVSPPWRTDWMSDAGRRKLREYGIAPPRSRGADMRLLQLAVECPVCGAAHTNEVAHFASTPCQALRRCGSCSEPFQH